MQRARGTSPREGVGLRQEVALRTNVETQGLANQKISSYREHCNLVGLQTLVSDKLGFLPQKRIVWCSRNYENCIFQILQREMRTHVFLGIVVKNK